MSRYTAVEIKNWDTSVESREYFDGFGRYAFIPARPKTYWNPIRRFFLAIGVFVGSYDALDWEDDSTCFLAEKQRRDYEQ